MDNADARNFNVAVREIGLKIGMFVMRTVISNGEPGFYQLKYSDLSFLWFLCPLK